MAPTLSCVSVSSVSVKSPVAGSSQPRSWTSVVVPVRMTQSGEVPAHGGSDAASQDVSSGNVPPPSVSPEEEATRKKKGKHRAKIIRKQVNRCEKKKEQTQKERKELDELLEEFGVEQGRADLCRDHWAGDMHSAVRALLLLSWMLFILELTKLCCLQSYLHQEAQEAATPVLISGPTAATSAGSAARGLGAVELTPGKASSRRAAARGEGGDQGATANSYPRGAADEVAAAVRTLLLLFALSCCLFLHQRNSCAYNRTCTRRLIKLP